MKIQFLKFLLFIHLKSLPSFVLLFLISTLFFSACTVEERYSNTGEFTFTLNAENEVTQVTRSDDDPDIPLPDINDFLIIIKQKEGSFYAVYEDLREITGPLTLPVGNYEITASYGLEDSEGFGLDAVYYEGKAEFSILENQSTAVEVTCSLANVVVSVDLSDVFVKYFANYTVMARSLTTNKVFMFTEENDILYLKPGGFSLILEVTKQNGVSSTYEPVTVTDSKAQQYYILNVDVNEGNVGGDRLVITFSDEVESEAIEIDLSDEAMSAKEPFFTLTGFESGVPIEIAEGTHLGELSVLVTARGSFKSCVITTQSPFLTTAIWPSPVDLISIPAAQEIVLKKYGLNWTASLPDAGQNPDLKMAILEFSDLLPHLKAVNDEGKHELTLVVVDQNNKKSEELKLIVHTRENSLKLETPEPVLIGSPSALFTVQTEGDIQQLEIQYMDAYGIWHSGSTEVVSSEGKEYVVRTTLPIENKPLQVRAKYNSVTSPIEYLDVMVPKFSLQLENEGDVWATKAYLKLVPDNPTELNAIKKYLIVYVNDRSVEYFWEGEKLILTTLPHGTLLNVIGTCGKDEFSKEISLATEAIINLPNSDFEQGWTVYYNETINMNGRFGMKALVGSNVTWRNGGNPLTKNLLVHSISGWTNVNDKTMPVSAMNENTWYIVPSTEQTDIAFEGNFAVKLRNVAWDHTGEEIADYIAAYNWSGNPTYSQTVPDIKYRSVGKLFLGEYSFDYITGEEVYDEGIVFDSRPLSLSGYYLFNDLGDDEGGTVSVILENNGDIIAKGYAVLTPIDNYTKFIVPLEYSDLSKKATHLKVMFTSSTKSSYDQVEESSNITTIPRVSATEAVSTGSELYLDNIQLNYE